MASIAARRLESRDLILKPRGSLRSYVPMQSRKAPWQLCAQVGSRAGQRQAGLAAPSHGRGEHHAPPSATFEEGACSKSCSKHAKLWSLKSFKALALSSRSFVALACSGAKASNFSLAAAALLADAWWLTRASSNSVAARFCASATRQSSVSAASTAEARSFAAGLASSTAFASTAACSLRRAPSCSRTMASKEPRSAAVFLQVLGKALRRDSSRPKPLSSGNSA
mmetsp:Transcript_124062/g.310091  ORF Transcript_124062/g.310091 Transcript_124062/m.310091 type:complete len:225 (+) Transcript_124062:128-802(+)